ncbi:hypothetical protein IG631_09522 [Alternaria alternata]|nr:hypothetical protein IG631_09522 [Alternaria alternata]
MNLIPQRNPAARKRFRTRASPVDPDRNPQPPLAISIRQSTFGFSEQRRG